MDLFVVPPLARRDLVWIDVTTHPTAEWVARQITEAFPWDMAPRYMIRDRATALSSRADCVPWASGTSPLHQPRLGRMAFDHLIVLGEAHLRRILKSYADYYNGVRTHLSLNKDASVSRLVQRAGVIRSRAILGGLHHRYARV
jgi:hypothetical protein